MLTLHQTPAVWGLPNLSPFCFKLETYLRMTERPYRTAPASFRKAPKGKVPYIADGDVLLGDSGFIIDYLARTYGDPLDADLDQAARARAVLLRRMFEEHCYFTFVYLRYTHGPAWPHMVAAFAPIFPPGMKQLGPKLVRRAVIKECHGQGAGRHNRQELLSVVESDLAALATELGDQPYFLGAAPHTIDATAYAFLALVLWTPWDSEEKELLRSHTNLVSYLERMKERYWAGWSPGQNA